METDNIRNDISKEDNIENNEIKNVWDNVGDQILSEVDRVPSLGSRKIDDRDLESHYLEQEQKDNNNNAKSIISNIPGKSHGISQVKKLKSNLNERIEKGEFDMTETIDCTKKFCNGVWKRITWHTFGYFLFSLVMVLATWTRFEDIYYMLGVDQTYSSHVTPDSMMDKIVRMNNTTIPFNLTRSELENLIISNTPVLQFSSFEEYYPDTPDNIIKHSRLLYRGVEVELYNTTTLEQKHLIGEDIVDPDIKLKLSQHKLNILDMISTNQDFDLDIGSKIWNGDKNNLQNVPIYCSIIPMEEIYFNQPNKKILDLVFFILYAYNGEITRIQWAPSSTHTGDIERIMVRLDITNSSNPINVGYFYSSHSVGRFLSINKVDIYNNSQPIVYVARFSHAGHNKKGVIQRLFGLANDYTDGGGVLWNPRIVDVVDLNTLNNNNKWVHFVGRMGISTPLYKNGWFRPISDIAFISTDLENNILREKIGGDIDIIRIITRWISIILMFITVIWVGYYGIFKQFTIFVNKRSSAFAFMVVVLFGAIFIYGMVAFDES